MAVSKKRFSPSRPTWWTGILISLGIGALFYAGARQTIEHDASARFRHQARNAQHNIDWRISAYTDVLRGAASFFQATGQVTRENFHRYVDGLDIRHRFPALDNINYAQYVTAADRPAFERQAGRSGDSTADGYPNFSIDPPALRADYWVLTMIEPLQGFREKIGRDIASRPLVARALEQGRDNNETSGSGMPIDSVHQPAGAGLALRMPVYRKDMPLETVEQRRSACIGSVGIGFSVPRLTREALEQIQAHGVRLRLFDGDVRLYDSQPDAQALHPDDMFSVALPVEFNRHHWSAHFSAAKSNLYSRLDTWLPWLAMLCGFVGAMLFYLLFHTLSSSRLRAIQLARAMTQELRNSQEKLQQSHQKLRRLAAHSDQIIEEERKRIAREIHDDLGQNLLVLRIEADLLATRTRNRHPRLHRRVNNTLGQIDRTIKSVRHVINDLRPTVLDLGLTAAVEWQIAQFRQHSGMVCELIEHEGDIQVNDHCATAFFRVLQESLSNIMQHARASLVRVELRQADGRLSMTISDNGVGLRADSRNKMGSFGLVGIEERISLLGGGCSITGSPNGGTMVAVSVPAEIMEVS